MEGGRNMKTLFIVMSLMQFAVLTNITLFDGAWNGITMLVCTVLYVIACWVYGITKQQQKEKNPS